jgi:hypothetical protein
MQTREIMTATMTITTAKQRLLRLGDAGFPRQARQRVVFAEDGDHWSPSRRAGEHTRNFVPAHHAPTRLTRSDEGRNARSFEVEIDDENATPFACKVNSNADQGHSPAYATIEAVKRYDRPYSRLFKRILAGLC